MPKGHQSSGQRRLRRQPPGFKGAEDSGNGLKAIFESNSAFSGDTRTDLNRRYGRWRSSSTRHAYVGVTGGFGTVVGGRLDGVRYGIFNKYDAFAAGTVGNFTQMTGQVDRANSAVAYISPNWSGFSFVGAYATNIGSQTNGSRSGPSTKATVTTLTASCSPFDG